MTSRDSTFGDLDDAKRRLAGSGWATLGCGWLLLWRYEQQVAWWGSGIASGASHPILNCSNVGWSLEVLLPAVDVYQSINQFAIIHQSARVFVGSFPVLADYMTCLIQNCCSCTWGCWSCPWYCWFVIAAINIFGDGINCGMMICLIHLHESFIKSIILGAQGSIKVIDI